MPVDATLSLGEPTETAGVWLLEVATAADVTVNLTPAANFHGSIPLVIKTGTTLNDSGVPDGDGTATQSQTITVASIDDLPLGTLVLDGETKVGETLTATIPETFRDADNPTGEVSSSTQSALFCRVDWCSYCWF